MLSLNPYLNFNGNCRAAMEFYKTCLGGDLHIQTFGESGMPGSESVKDQVIHATLTGDGWHFMASDGGQHNQVTFGTHIHMSMVGDDLETMTEMFNKLSTGGTITMPLQKQFWGDTFGMITDKFSIGWMFNISEKK